MAGKTTSPSHPVLRRYTSLPSLLHILQNKQITLLSPSSWDDRNDAYYMSQYKARKKLKTLLALCFAETDETYHHWRVFTQGSDGACISFDRDKFIALVEKETSIRSDYVIYKKIAALKSFHPKTNQLPFLKRYPYGDECEYRLIYEDAKTEIEAKSFRISLDCIDRVTLNPWLAKPLAETVRKTLKSLDGCRDLRVATRQLCSKTKKMEEGSSTSKSQSIQA